MGVAGNKLLYRGLLAALVSQEVQDVPKPIIFTVRGTDRFGDDAPTVEDLLGQIETWIGVLRNVEEAVAEGGRPELVWRVTDARKTPL